MCFSPKVATKSPTLSLVDPEIITFFMNPTIAEMVTCVEAAKSIIPTLETRPGYASTQWVSLQVHASIGYHVLSDQIPSQA